LKQSGIFNSQVCLKSWNRIVDQLATATAILNTPVYQALQTYLQTWPENPFLQKVSSTNVMAVPHIMYQRRHCLHFISQKWIFSFFSYCAIAFSFWCFLIFLLFNSGLQSEFLTGDRAALISCTKTFELIGGCRLTLSLREEIDLVYFAVPWFACLTPF